jgi:hypothetical protein
VEHQRIFHLGRELKSGGRSLLKLGLGRFNNHVLHLHIPPNDHDSKEETSLSASGSTTASGKRRRKGTEAIKSNNNSDGVIDLIDDSEDDEALIDDSEVKRPRVS